MCDSERRCGFPLPLTVFEQYMLTDDRRDYPMNFVIMMDLHGCLVRSAFESALKEAMARHPLMGARVDRTSSRKPFWIAGNGGLPWIDWGATGDSLSHPDGEYLDLTRDSGLRFWIRQGEERVEITFQCHHSLCDGVGVMKFLGDLLMLYANATAQDASPCLLPPVDAAKLPLRGQYKIEFPEPVSSWQIVKSTIHEAIKWFVRRPMPLGVNRSQPSKAISGGKNPPLFSTICSHLFSKEETALLRAAAKRRNVTLNDLLLRDLFLAIVEWNRNASQSMGRWLRINMPVDMRCPEDADMPAVNRMSYTFLTRRAAECGDSRKLLEGIRWETDLIKRWSLGHYFLSGVGFVQWMTGFVPFLFSLSSQGCLATSVSSYLGEVSRRLGTALPVCDGRLVVGNLVLERMTGVPPVRPKTRAAFGIMSYAGQLAISVRCDPHVFSRENTDSFLAVFVNCLKKTMTQEDC